MRKLVLRSVASSAVTILSLSAVASVGVASASNTAEYPGSAHQVYSAASLPINEMPAQKTGYDDCRRLENQGHHGYAMQNRDGVSRVYEFAGWHSDPQGYTDMRVNVYVDEGNWIHPGGWSKGELLGHTFIGCQ